MHIGGHLRLGIICGAVQNAPLGYMLFIHHCSVRQMTTLYTNVEKTVLWTISFDLRYKNKLCWHATLQQYKSIGTTLKQKLKLTSFTLSWRNSYFIKLLYRYLCLFDSFILSCKIFVAQKNALVASFKRNIFSETKLKELMIKIHMFLRRGKMTERRD